MGSEDRRGGAEFCFPRAWWCVCRSEVERAAYIRRLRSPSEGYGAVVGRHVHTTAVDGKMRGATRLFVEPRSFHAEPRLAHKTGRPWLGLRQKSGIDCCRALVFPTRPLRELALNHRETTHSCGLRLERRLDGCMDGHNWMKFDIGTRGGNSVPSGHFLSIWLAQWIQ